MPIDDKGNSSQVVSITGETVQLYYYNSSGVLTSDAGQAAGTSVVGKLAYDNVKNALGAMEGSKRDTSLSFTSTDLTSEQDLNFATIHSGDELSGVNRLARIVEGLTNGQYVVDYTTGTIYGKKAGTGTTLTSAAYKIMSGLSGGSSAIASDVNVSKVGGVATAASAALADAVANPTVGSFGAYLRGFNGTTWDRLRTAVVTASATMTGFLNTLPWAVYNATPTTRTEGQGGPLQATTLGGLHVAEQFAPKYENNSDSIAWIQPRPISSSTAAISTDISAALEASTVTKASAGRLYGARVRIDSTHATASYYIQFLNASSLPADGAVTFLTAPIKVQHVNGTDSTVSIDLSNVAGVYASTGIVMCLSTTEFTKTISGAFTASVIFYA